MTSLGYENENGSERLPERVAGEPTLAVLGVDDPGRALDTARTRDRLDWEDRCEAVQREINQAYHLELNGKEVRLAAERAGRWCLVVVVASCCIAWTGWVALLTGGLAVAGLLLCAIGVALGGVVELMSQLRQWWLHTRGEKDHLEVYDPSLRPIR